MSEERIRDIPSIANLLRDAEGAALLAKWLPRVEPLLRLLGVDVNKMNEALASVDDLKRATEELTSIPDHFNQLFASRGWIVYDSLNVDVAKAAIAAGEAGDWEQAEDLLVNHYTEDMIRFQLRRLRFLKSFQPRVTLAERAAEDYLAARYHACVPVVLALLDGMVNDLAERGFFAKDADLTAWDSIAAHEQGLGQLAKILTQRRKKTRTEEISLPYRHGILHGMDLGYANKPVAAKTWAALFATADWARKVERGEKEPQPEESQPSWTEVLGQLRENADDRARLEAWIPREIEVGRDIPPTAPPRDYPARTPERSLAEFLELWRARNYGKMVNYLPYPRSKPLGPLAGELREIYGGQPLVDYHMQSISDKAAAVTEIAVACQFAEGSGSPDRTVTFRLVNEDEQGNPVIRGKPAAEWVIINYGWL